MSLKDLQETKGMPSGVRADFAPTYHEGKTIWINESGMYSLMFGSKKPEAKDFKNWVTRQVLPFLRRKGVYDMACSTNASVLALASTVSSLQLALQARDAALLPALQSHGAEQLEAARTSFLEALGSKLKSFFQLALAGHISAVVEAAVRSGLALKKAQPKKKTTSAADMPEDQRATPLQTGPLSLGLSTVALELFPEMPFAAWKKVRGSFGHHAKKERLRLHALGERHPEYVAAPLLWAYTGSASTVEGGGARYVYLAEHRALLQRVFRAQLQTSRAQRGAGAPAPTESLEQRVHRLAAGLSLAERAMQWPVHVAEFEPHWNEGDEGL
jgi:hypothetical protein